MTDAQSLEALLDIIDPERDERPGDGAQLTVLGLAERTGKGGYRPTIAGWNVLGAQGRKHRFA